MEIPSDFSGNSVVAGVGASIPLRLHHSLEQRAGIAAATQINESKLLGADRRLRLDVDPRSRREVLNIVNTNTGEVLLQLPPELVLQIAELLHKRS
jgi:uncharacterized FlaG/YvyC family protein